MPANNKNRFFDHCHTSLSHLTLRAINRLSSRPVALIRSFTSIACIYHHVETLTGVRNICQSFNDEFATYLKFNRLIGKV